MRTASNSTKQIGTLEPPPPTPESESGRRFAGRKKQKSLRKAFTVARDGRHTGPLPRISDITKAQLDHVVGEILGGVTPFVAAGNILGISWTTHYRWMEEGRSENSPEYYRWYFDEIHRAEMEARGGIEKRIYNKSPEFYAIHSGTMRTRVVGTQVIPGWTPETTTRHADFSGEKDFEIVFSELGPKSQPVPKQDAEVSAEPPRELTEVEERGGE
jgi:hypothetical protein